MDNIILKQFKDDQGFLGVKYNTDERVVLYIQLLII
jgi:hypothetical protein